MKFILVRLDRTRFIGPFDSMDDAFSHMQERTMLDWYVTMISPPSVMA